MKHEATQNVVAGIRRVMAGEIYLSDQLTSRLMYQFVQGNVAGTTQPVKTLSNRELEIFQLIGQGFKTHEISEKLHLSVKTIETHRDNIKHKLHLETSTELLRTAIEWVHGAKTD